MIRQGEIWWAEVGVPTGSAPGFHRPVVVIQGDEFNEMKIGTVLCVAVTSRRKWASAPGNVALSAVETGLDRDSVANISQIITLDRKQLEQFAAQVPDNKLAKILDGVSRLIGR